MNFAFNMPFKVSVNKKKCIGCAICGIICPEFFEAVDSPTEQKFVPKFKEIEAQSLVAEAEIACPTKAISAKEK